MTRSSRTGSSDDARADRRRRAAVPVAGRRQELILTMARRWGAHDEVLNAVLGYDADHLA
jgi:hypothetical protein